MSHSAAQKALIIPEILEAIARAIPIFTRPSDYDDFTPHTLFQCILVSRLWYRCFLPFLYHYYVGGQVLSDEDISPESREVCINAIRKNSHLFRRFQAYWDIAKEDLPFDGASPPTNLVGLFISNTSDRLADLLYYNQGPQLKQLIWRGTWRPVKVEPRYQDALMNLPCLEELELSTWIVSNELLTGILRTCSSTLKTLTLGTIQGFDKMLFVNCDTNKYNDHHGDEDNTGAHPLFQLTNLTTLNIDLDWTQSRGTVYLPRICPALQNLVMTVDEEEHDLSQLITSLRTCCPQLTSIKYKEGYSMRHEQGFFPGPELHASLFKDSTTCLKTMCTGLPIGLDSHMINAILSHASNLEDLQLKNHSRYDDEPETERGLDVSGVQKIFAQCRNLKQFVLLDAMLSIKDLEYLCTEPWVCHNLENLIIKDDTQTGNEDDDVKDGIKNGSDRGRLQDGWFRVTCPFRGKSGDAQVDNEFISKFLLHLSETSGLKSLRYIRLNGLQLYKCY